MSSDSSTGKTKSQGWEIGVRRTLPASQARAWNMILDALGIPWKEGPEAPVYKKQMTFKTEDQTQIEIRSFEAYNLIRMKWQPKDWESVSTLQIRILPAKSGTTISIHHEWLTDAEHRERMRVYWMTLLDDLKESLA